MTAKKSKALAALLTEPTKGRAAEKAGVDVRTLNRWLSEDKDFQDAYESSIASLVDDAAQQARKALDPALSCLREIVEDSQQGATSRVAAARSLLEYSLRLIEISDILKALERAEGDHVL